MCIVVTSTQSFHWVVLLFYITGGCRVSKLRPNLSRYKILSGPQLGVRGSSRRSVVSVSPQHLSLPFRSPGGHFVGDSDVWADCSGDPDVKGNKRP